jgi:hypothetical protein
MKYPVLLRAAAVAAALGAGGVLAQTATPITASPVMSDAAPLPAEDRASTGAVVLQNSLVRAQRDQAFEKSAARNGVTSVGRGVLRATMRAQTEADLAQAKVNDAVNLQDRGAASLDEK